MRMAAEEETHGLAVLPADLDDLFVKLVLRFGVQREVGHGESE